MILKKRGVFKTWCAIPVFIGLGLSQHLAYLGIQQTQTWLESEEFFVAIKSFECIFTDRIPLIMANEIFPSWYFAI